MTRTPWRARAAVPLTRRAWLLAGGSFVAFAGALLRGGARADPAAAAAAIEAFTGGRTPAPGMVSLAVPEIAEDGNMVPVTIEVASPMTADAYVEAVALFADDNPNPEVATFRFTPLSGSALAVTRIRLARSQNVIAIARMSDGVLFMDRKRVMVTIGGCGAGA